MNKPINTPFGYFGSKNKISLQICRDLPPHNAWVEAFCGSAALTLAKIPAPIEVINDIDGQIVNFFEQLRTNSENLCKAVALTPYAREELLQARNSSRTPAEPLERARRFLVMAMMAINGVFGEKRGGFSCSQSYSRGGREARVNRWYHLPERLSLVVERLRDIRIENRDAREIIQMFMNRPATLIYLDPPYLGVTTNGYNIDAKQEIFHEELLRLANRSNCMIFISGYDNELYASYLTTKRGWSKKVINTTTKDSKGKHHARTEVLWMNKYFRLAMRKGKTPISLSKIEKQLGKINPTRE